MLLITIEEKKLLKKIAQKYSLELILLFGSRVSEKTYKESDFDVAYLSKKELDLMEEAELICDLMPVFQSENIDLVNLKRAGPLLMKQIFENHKILFCSDPKIYYRYKIYAERKYVEAQPLFQLNEYLIKQFLKEYA